MAGNGLAPCLRKRHTLTLLKWTHGYFVVERLFGVRQRKGVKLRWLGFDTASDTWELESHVNPALTKSFRPNPFHNHYAPICKLNHMLPYMWQILVNKDI